ncbi:hypothetical protein GlitD10_0009 [Gloeomargarita lithophora Alchichica-D10]|uniref:DUF3119 family protein n=1 Tax=Gloeomargarita lithophora Alchichica-D10 TaxID=1188229 RepID=A0A1J0A8Q8_9CYAN|nr:DUF3119 family protein [Gloeomargarita lithophora]APB32310.1 hypothetical protein GlitD10_0009 [Gloeomargarita lithophora Alchichica-D10]
MQTTSPALAVPFTLNPDYRVALGLAGMGLAVTAWSWPTGLGLGAMAAFLGWQSAVLRLTFTETAVVLTRNGAPLREFPYRDWQDWYLFWPGLPVILFFREVHSIHFVPVLFDPLALSRYLAHYCPPTEAR